MVFFSKTTKQTIHKKNCNMVNFNCILEKKKVKILKEGETFNGNWIFDEEKN
jgi:hypothetical protein